MHSHRHSSNHQTVLKHLRGAGKQSGHKSLPSWTLSSYLKKAKMKNTVRQGHYNYVRK